MKEPTIEERKAFVDDLLRSKIGEFEGVIIIGKSGDKTSVTMAMLTVPEILEATMRLDHSVSGVMKSHAEPAPDAKTAN